jgi:hypothetical protein
VPPVSSCTSLGSPEIGYPVAGRFAGGRRRKDEGGNRGEFEPMPADVADEFLGLSREHHSLEKIMGVRTAAKISMPARRPNM